MKKYAVTIIAGLAALAVAGSASAQTVVRITGSTAFRKATVIAIGHVLSPGYTYGYAGSSFTSANQQEFRGTLAANTNLTVDIKCSWAGSVGGVQTVVQNLSTNAAACSLWLNATNLTTGGTSGLTGPYDAAVTADVTMSDSFQGSTAFTSPQLVDTIVGVVAFQWVANVGSPDTIANISTLQAQELLSVGQMSLALFTGVDADTNTLVTAIGRDEDSGTRLGTFAETGFGIFGAPFQYEPEGTITGTNAGANVTGLIPWPVNTVNGITYPVGHSGYSSGSGVALALGTPGTGSLTPPTWLIGYLGIPDATNAILYGGHALTWNGFAYSPTAIIEGQYTFWTYEHLMYRTSFAGNQKTVADTIANQILTADAVQAGVLLGSMKVSRTVEGGLVSQSY